MHMRFFSRSTFASAMTLLILAETPEAPYAHELPHRDAHTLSASPPPPTSLAAPTPFQTDWTRLASSAQDLVSERSVKGPGAGAGDSTNSGMASCADGNKGACKDLFGNDAWARKKFEARIGGIIKDLLAAEMEDFIKDVSGRALDSLTDELLSLTLNGEEYLCLNFVR